jgi:hypothetical protein
MAIGDPYATVDDLKSYLFKQQEVKAALYDSDLISALNSASQDIEEFCGRQFNRQDTPSTRIYVPKSLKRCFVDDFFTTTGMVLNTDPGGTGTFSQPWDVTTEVEMFPLNNTVAGVPNWPFNELHACRGLYFPKYAPNPYRRIAVVQLTASWGWAAVPAPVHQACLIMAAETWKLRDAPFGVAGFTQFGGAVKVRDNPMACRKLQKYVLNAAQVG